MDVVPVNVTVKLVAAVRAVMSIGKANVAAVVLHVMLNFVPRVSSDCRNIWLLAVTAEVLT